MPEQAADSPRLGGVLAAGVVLGALTAAAVAGIVPAQVSIGLCAAALLIVIGTAWPLPTVTLVALPALAVIANLFAPINIGGRNLHFVFLVAPVLLVLWAVRFTTGATSLRVPHALALLTWLLAFFIATILRSPLRSQGLGTTLLLALLMSVYCLLAWAVTAAGAKRLDLALAALFVGMGGYALIGALILLGHLFEVLPPGWAVEMRSISDIAGQNVAGRVLLPANMGTVPGSYFAAVTVLGVGVLLQERDRVMRAAALIGVVGGVAGMVMSLARGPLVGMAVGLVVLAIWQGKGQALRYVGRLALVLVVLAVPAAIYLSVSADARAAVMGRLATLFDLQSGTTVDRLLLWARMFEDVRIRPILGSGADAFRVFREPAGYPAESFPIEILHASGLIGLGAFAAWLALLGRDAWRATADTAPRAAGAFAAFLGLNVAVATNPGGWGSFYWVLAGIAAAAASTRTTPPPQED